MRENKLTKLEKRNKIEVGIKVPKFRLRLQQIIAGVIFIAIAINWKRSL